MIKLNEIDKHIAELLNYLESIQNDDGSFDTMYLQPYYNPDKGWMNYAGNSPYETAYPLTVLTLLQSAKSQKITKKGIQYILDNSLDNFLWTYSYPSKNALVPYDTDSTSLCSYVLEKNDYSVSNKNFLNEFIDSKSYYLFYIWNTRFDAKIPFVTHLKLKWRNWKTRNSSNITNKILQLNDSEFTSTCINLLYLGKSKENENVWQKIQGVFKNKTIDFLYYIDLFHAIYAYARLIGYGHHKEMIPNLELLDEYLTLMAEKLDKKSYSPQSVLMMNTILLFDIDLAKYQSHIQTCFNEIAQEKYKHNTAFYSSNSATDTQPGTTMPNTYFGSPAITCTLYLEFLNFYRKKMFGSYYVIN
jgi:hypothetical protein